MWMVCTSAWPAAEISPDPLTCVENVLVSSWPMLTRPEPLIATCKWSVRSAAASGHPCLVVTGGSDSAFVRNFNPFANAVDFTLGGIYEPLVVIGDPRSGRLYKWLASGLAWSKDTSTNPVSQETGKLLRRLGINGRKGLGFYTLRHVFETVGGGAKDQIAVPR